jgi:hypothetical protein
MKEYRLIGVASTPHNKTLRKIFEDVDIRSTNSNLEAIGSSFFVRLSVNDPRLPMLIASLDKLQLDPSYDFRREIEYDREDLEAAEFLVLSVDRAPKGLTGPLQDTEYDLSTGCPECGTGSRQVSPLRISAKALPAKGHLAQTYSHEVLVSEHLATELRIELRGDRALRQVEDRRSREKLPWWQILPDTYMPPLAPETRGLSGSGLCPKCKRDGFGYGLPDPFEPAYRMSRAERSKQPDFVFTWEHFGVSQLKWEPGRSIGLAYPGTLVSNRAMRVFLKNEVRGVKFIPVRFV